MKDGFYTMKMVFAQPAVEVASRVGTITSQFGQQEKFRTHVHHGIDYACPTGTEIHAPVDGIVSAVKDYGDVNLGKAVFVKMEDGQQYVVGHLSQTKVEVGEHIETGELLALSGNSGHSTGPHLHFGAFNKDGGSIDPGNVPWSAFENSDVASNTTGNVDLGGLDPSKGIEQIPDGGWLGHAGKWVGEHVQGGASWILEPVGHAIGEASVAILVSFLHALPFILVTGGFISFLLTIIFAHQKPYFYGLGMWGASAILRGIFIETGI